MELPTVRRKAIQNDPHVLTIFGQSKIGKTTMINNLENCLIIDTERGTKHLESLAVNVNSLTELGDVIKTIKENNYTYDFIALDTIDKIVDWVEAFIVKEYNNDLKDKGQKYQVKVIGDIPYGAGYDAVRSKIMGTINIFKSITNRLIIVGHRKKTIIGESKVEFTSNSLDLTGKLRTFICSDSDAVGYVFREGENLMISFKPSDEVEAGSRCNHLKGQIIPFDWSQIYIDKFKKE